jgi:hypothetical protein
VTNSYHVPQFQVESVQTQAAILSVKLPVKRGQCAEHIAGHHLDLTKVEQQPVTTSADESMKLPAEFLNHVLVKQEPGVPDFHDRQRAHHADPEPWRFARDQPEI